MLLTIAICLGLFIALTIHFLFVAQGRLIVGPESLFLLLGVSTFVATELTVFGSGSYSHPYASFIGLGLLCFVSGTVLSRLVLGFGHRRALEQFIARPWIDDLRGSSFQLVLLMGFLALLVTGAYFYLLGFFVPIQALRTLLTGGEGEMYAVYKELRRASHATGAYLAPGYVYQFKNTLLPLVAIILYFRSRVRPSLWSYGLFYLFLASTVFALVGIGRRYPVAFFAASFLIVALARYMAPFRFSRRRATALVVLAVLILSGLTLMMGTRGMEKAVDHSLLWAPVQVLDRAVSGPAQEKVIVYELFLEDKAPMWGRGSLQQLEVLLPGKSEFNLANELHELVYGSPEGNVGLDFWGTLWYDFHWWGLVPAFLFGFACNLYYVRLLRGPKRFVRVVTLAYAGLILGLATDLSGLVIKGFLTCLIFLFVVSFVRLLQRSLDHEGRARTGSGVIGSPIASGNSSALA